MLEKNIANKIKELRKNIGLTLDQLGGLTDLSKGQLSKIENCQVTPPIGTLSKISHALGVPIGIFFESETVESLEEQGYIVTRKDERKQVDRLGTRAELDYYSLSSLKSGNFIEPFILKYYASDKKTNRLYDHSGEEFLLVLKGEIDFIYGKKKIRLQTGDSIHFDPTTPHRGQNAGETDSECLIIVIEKEKK